MINRRRDFIRKIGLTGIGLSILPYTGYSFEKVRVGEELKKNGGYQNGAQIKFTLPELDYRYEELAPIIDEKTMRIHHGKHHAGYVKKLNIALDNADKNYVSIQEILKSVGEDERSKALRNNAGGHYNHSLFWKILAPGARDAISGLLKSKIEEEYENLNKLKEEFIKVGSNLFGSGWVWLMLDKNDKIAVCTTENQDNPLMTNIVQKAGKPILGIDLWEHAYYLNYQNERGAYLTRCWDLINWRVVSDNYYAFFDQPAIGN